MKAKAPTTAKILENLTKYSFVITDNDFLLDCGYIDLDAQAEANKYLLFDRDKHRI